MRRTGMARLLGFGPGLLVVASGFVPTMAQATPSVPATVRLPALVAQTITWSPSVRTVVASAASLTPSPLARTTPTAAGAIRYSVTGGTAACSVNATTAVITWTRAGSCIVRASAAQTAVYSAASTTVTFTITGIAQATLRLAGAPTSGPVGTTIRLSTSGGSGTGAVIYSVSGQGCTLTGSSLTANRVTRCSVTATKTASGLYRSATSAAVSFAFTGSAQTPLVISNTTKTAAAGTSITLTTTGGSGTGAVTFAATGSGCAVSGSALSASAPATCSVVATKAASGAFGAATSPAVVFTFTGSTQVPLVISNTTTTGIVGTSITLTTTGGSGSGVITFAVTGTGCSVSGSSLSASAATTCSVVATKAASGAFGATSSPAVGFAFTSAGVPVPSTLFGIHIDPQSNGATSLAPRVVRLWDVQVGWRDVNPSKGVFVWTTLDRKVAEVEALGAQPVLVFGLTPLWAASSLDGDPVYGAGSAAAPVDMADYSAYVTAVASRYRGRIAGYEAWNEANLKTYWTGTPAQMADITQRAHDAVKAADPGAQVIAASTSLRLSGSLRNFTTPYYQALMARGWPIDAFSIHTYPSGVGTPIDRYTLIQSWFALISTVSGSTPAALGKSVMDSEVNYGLAGPGTTPGTHFDDATGAAYLARTYVDSVRLGMSSTIWYLWTAANYDLLGVQMGGFTPAVNKAFAVLQSWLEGSTFRGCISTGAVTECGFVKNGAPFTLTFADAPGTPYANGFGTAHFIDGTSAAGASVTSLGFAPVRFD